MRYFKFPPQTIKDLYVDDYDFMGLLYWYNDAIEQNNEAKELYKKPPK